MASAASIAMEHDLEGSTQSLPGAQRRRGPRKTAEEMTALAMQVRLLRPAKPSLTLCGLSQPSPLQQWDRCFVGILFPRLIKSCLSLCADSLASKLPQITRALPDTLCRPRPSAALLHQSGPSQDAVLTNRAVVT